MALWDTTGSENGYEYHYRFGIDDEIIQRYSCLNIRDDVRFLLEIRTNFRVKGSDDGYGETIDTERFEIDAQADESGRIRSPYVVEWRLADYWMSHIETDDFEAELSAFANAADRRGRRVTPIAVEMDVCTVRGAGETAAAAAGRAMISGDLCPVWLVYDRNLFAELWKPAHRDLIRFLRLELPRVRMEADHYLSCFMEECMICRRGPAIGAKIVELRDYCGHAFHYGCLVRHLILADASCPLCSHPILPTARARAACIRRMETPNTNLFFYLVGLEN
ncbi:hypothetical protein OROGR_002372 [Orobanche gracilis]